jgi:hypothetical protein
MTPPEARELLHIDAIVQKNEEMMSASEWEERVNEEKVLREAAALAGPGVVNAISRFVWKWDQPTRKIRIR